MYRWLAVLRLVLVANTVGLNLYRGGFSHPVAGGLVIGLMVVWTLLVTWVMASFPRRTTGWFLADLAVALAAVAATPLVKEPGFHTTLPGFWVMGAMLAWSIHWRWQGGLLAAVLLAVGDLLTRHYLSETVYGNLFLLLVGGPIVGLMVDSLLRSSARTAIAERSAAAASERARLARAVHDGVLQTLSLVQRRAADLGEPGAELSRLAAEQETALRSLIRQQDTVRDPGAGTVDLVGALSAFERRPGVSVATPDGGVVVERVLADGIVAAVSACLDNVAAHVGDGARAWVLLESLPDALEVSVRDEGPGFAPGRLEEAERAGRLGVSSSIRGRVTELGGTAVVASGSFGTEWELRFPRSTVG